MCSDPRRARMPLAGAWLALTACVLAACVLAACGPLPRPFEALPAQTEMLLPGDFAGVAVAPVAGAPPDAARALRDTMMAALHEANVPADGLGNEASARLSGAVRAGDGTARSRIAVVWTLRDAAGTVLGTAVAEAEGDPAAWEAAEPRLVRALVLPAAPALAHLLQGEVPMERPPGPRVALWPVAGLPGGADLAMLGALRRALNIRGVEVVETLTGAEPVVAGEVEIRSRGDGMAEIVVLWTLMAPEGTTLGTIRQANAVPAARVSGATGWSTLADPIADGAAEGIADLFRRMPPPGDPAE